LAGARRLPRLDPQVCGCFYEGPAVADDPVARRRPAPWAGAPGAVPGGAGRSHAALAPEGWRSERTAARGLAYEANGDHDRAIADYDETLRLDSEDPVAFYNRGIAYENKHDYDHAIDYSKAIRLDPEYAEAYLVRGISYENKRELEKALADFRVALNHESLRASSKQKARDGVERFEQKLAAGRSTKPAAK
jgi:tetratricopeptide (TPR) repeat protein